MGEPMGLPVATVASDNPPESSQQQQGGNVPSLQLLGAKNVKDSYTLDWRENMNVLFNSLFLNDKSRNLILDNTKLYRRT